MANGYFLIFFQQILKVQLPYVHIVPGAMEAMHKTDMAIVFTRVCSANMLILANEILKNYHTWGQDTEEKGQAL